MSCVPVQSAWSKVVETGFCSEIMDGFYSMWIVAYLATAFIFILNVIADILNQYFEKHLWDLEAVERVGDIEMVANNTEADYETPKNVEYVNVTDIVQTDGDLEMAKI